MRRFAFLIVVLCAVSSSRAAHGDLRSDLRDTAIRYFVENANPQSGLVRDWAENFSQTPAQVPASMAATGFGFAVLAHAAQNGWMPREQAYELILRGLRFSQDHVERYHGWFLHFVDWNTGARIWHCEYSTIDTALFLAGALYAGQVFRGTEVERLATELYEQTDFIDMLTDGGRRPNKRTLSMSYSPETGYNPTQWKMYGEQMLLLILGLGHPTNPLPAEAWDQFDRLQDARGLMGADQALFVHQYSQLYLDLRKFRDSFSNYFSNSVQIAKWQRASARQDSRATFRAGFWGFSAGDSAGGYQVWDGVRHDSVACLGCVLGSLMHWPRRILADARMWRASAYGEKIWGRYGFVDSVDLDRQWTGTKVFGITVGPVYLSLANTDERTSIWNEFMQLSFVKKGLSRAAAARLQTSEGPNLPARQAGSPEERRSGS